MATRRKPKAEPESIAHRQYGVNDDHAAWCREVIDFENRQDSVPALNGVEVGQYWRNVHVGSVQRVVEIRLGGLGTHAAHYESIVLLKEGQEVADMFDISGQALWSICDHWEQVELAGDEWVAADPQPFVWEARGDAREQRANGTYRDERAWVGRVRHDRPKGKPMLWEGQRRTAWAFYENGVLACDGIVVGSFMGFNKRRYEGMVERFPLVRPKAATMRKVLPVALNSSTI
jgi:hypothetical protein